MTIGTPRNCFGSVSGYWFLPCSELARTWPEPSPRSGRKWPEVIRNLATVPRSTPMPGVYTPARVPVPAAAASTASKGVRLSVWLSRALDPRSAHAHHPSVYLTVAMVEGRPQPRMYRTAENCDYGKRQTTRRMNEH